METRLAAINVTKCKELQKISLGVLRKEFGQKTGDNLFKYARGICNRQLQFSHERKSVSAEVNYGIRFQNTEEALKFLQELTVEVSKRLKDISAKGKVVCLKIKVRKEDADVEPAKFLGHGSCDNVTRSVSLQDYTDCSSVIFKNCSYLLQMMKVLPQDLRGVCKYSTDLYNAGWNSSSKVEPQGPYEETKTQSTLSSMFIKMSEKNSKKKLDNAPNDSLPSGSKNSCTDNRIVSINKNAVQKGPGITEKINQLVSQSKLGLNSKHDSSISSTSLGDFYPSQYCQLDESVLNQLPDDIRYQIKEHYSKNKSSRDEDQLTNEAPVTERNISSLPNITSIDQSVFSSLPADIQNELRSAYSNQISNTLPSPLKSENIKSNQKQILSYKSSPSKSPLKGKWRKKKKSSPMKIVPGNSKITNHLIPTKSNFKETCHRHEVVDIEDSKNSDELKEPTLNGKNSISDIKILIQEWALMCQVPSDDDIKVFSDYLVDLVNFKDLEKLDLVVKCLHRQLSKKDNLWHEAYFDIINNIQAEVISNYGRALHVNMVF
ncbi:DNA repair protein REV1 [Nymphon striatum]|nr:DNA repair protein REV1 [Nymphon striatum]KAG1652115.1 DNA repair protein REV1 [Nymphon striatum]